MSIIIRAKSGESTDNLIRRFQRIVKEFEEGIRKPRVFVSKIEKNNKLKKKKLERIKNDK